MKSKLGPDEMQFIRSYIRKKGIKTIDLEQELLDHIASAIEERMENPDLGFYDAFKLEVIKYGTTGFRKLQDERYKILQKRGFSMFKAELKSFFNIPRIMITIIVSILTFELFFASINPFSVFKIAGVIFIFLYLTSSAYYIVLQSKKKFAQIKALHALYNICCIPGFYLALFSERFITGYPWWFYGVVTILIFITYAAFFLVFHKTYLNISRQYLREA